MAEFTKDELLAIIQIQSTTAIQLTAVVAGIDGIVERQQRILLAVETNLANNIVNTLDKNCKACRSYVEVTAKDVMWLKIFLGLIGLAAFVSFIMSFIHH